MALFSSKPQKANPAPRDRGVDTMIGAGARFEGSLHTDNSVCIEGTLCGRVSSASRIILNDSGVVEGDVVAEYVSINGKVLGNVQARTQLDVGATGVIEGDVEAKAITVAKGGVLRGSCSMADAGESEKPAAVEPRRGPRR